MVPVHTLNSTGQITVMTGMGCGVRVMQLLRNNPLPAGKIISPADANFLVCDINCTIIAFGSQDKGPGRSPVFLCEADQNNKSFPTGEGF